MDVKSFQNNLKQINNLLDHNHVAEVIDRIEKIMDEEGSAICRDEFNHVKQTYHYMIHYFVEGMADNSRESMFRNVVNSLRDIIQQLSIERNMADSSDLYYSVSRICRHRNLSFDSLIDKIEEINSTITLAEAACNDTHEIRIKKDGYMRELFDSLWTSGLTKEQASHLSQRVLNMKDFELAGYIVSSLIISLISVYDRRKLNTLIDIYDNTDSDKIAARSLVGIVIALDLYKKRVQEEDTILQKLSLWNDSILTYSRLRIIIRELIRARDTDRLTAKMKEEVLPELMKIQPEILKKMRESSMESSEYSEENNPEWEEILEKNGIADKLKEFTEMQMEGADLMMLSFSNLKGFPFFRNVNAWFLPFDASHPAINVASDALKSLGNAIDLNKLMCDADRYSLFLAFSSMPEQQRKMIFSQFEQQLSQMMDDLKDKNSKESHVEFNTETTLFIRELYRFFRLFNKRNEFKDPFDHPLDFLSLPAVNAMLDDEEILSVIGEFYFKKGYYTEALSILEKLEKTQGLYPQYWEKIGFIHQQSGEYQDALMAYQKAELLGDNGSWLLKNMARVNSKIGNYRAAYDYYKNAIDSDQDNISLILNAGFCLTKTEQYQEALKYYYHANYLKPDDPKILRAIAWGELLNNNFEKSANYYEKIMAANPSWVDYLNYGHLKLITGNVKDALSYYRQAYNGNEKEFFESFKKDSDILIKSGLNHFTLNLVLEAMHIRK